MAGMIEVRYDSAGLREIERQVAHIPHGLRRIVPPAINRSLSTMRTSVARDIRSSGLKKNVSAIKLGLLMRRANATRWNGRLEVSPRRYDLVKDFGAKASAKGGVTVRVLNSRINLPQAFIPAGTPAVVDHSFPNAAQMSPQEYRHRMAAWLGYAKRPRRWFGWDSVLMRKPKGGGSVTYTEAQTRKSLVGRLPVVKVKGPSLAELWARTPGLIAAVQKQAAALLHKELVSKTNWLLKKGA